MRILFILALSITLFFTLSGCRKSSTNTEATYHKITQKEAKKILDEKDAVILLDVRTKEEFKEQRIDGAILIPHDEIANRAEAELLDKDATILVYCRSGNRSKTAANTLVSLGYTKVYDFGGINTYPYETIAD